MTRHILAFLALLTGLAALGSPAQASLAEALACDSSIAAAACDETAGGDVVLGQPAPATPRASLEVEAPVCHAPAPGGLRLPVLMGIERAYE